MDVFLDRFAKEIILQIRSQPEKYCVVLPNRRAGLFLKRHLAGYIDTPIWAPAIFSIEDYIVKLSGMELMEPVELLFELYQVHTEVEGTDAQPFDGFLNWGKDLIRDFNEIDQYLADPHRLFTYLSEAKALSVWNLNHEPLTSFQQKYLRFYRSLESYYSLFSSRLLVKGKVYQGLAYRKLAESIEEVALKLPWKKVFFGGFNALTTAENKIIEYLFLHEQAALYWDADAYYMEDQNQEAGRFLRTYRNHSTFGPFQWTEAHFQSDKDIQVIGIPKNVGQAKMAGHILSSLALHGDQPENTALVLIDENLLLPVLNSLPETVKDFNITMGYPLKYTPVFDLIESLFTLHENAERFSSLSSKPGWKYYYKDVFRILHHPYIARLASSTVDINKEIAALEKKGIVFYEPDFLFNTFASLDPSFSEKIRLFFKKWGNEAQDALGCFQGVLEALRDGILPARSQDDRIEIEYIYHFSRLIVRIQSVLIKNPIHIETRTLRTIITQLAGYVTIPFYGEPLKGLQIMGMLETRNLDFENLILVSVNEDLIPAGKQSHSFIPFDIRQEFDLPTFKDHDAVFAYHFYRLLQRTRKAYLLYNTEPTELGGGEQSRFITQIQHEMPIYHKGVNIRSVVTSLPLQTDRRNFDIEVIKNEHIQQRLASLAESGLTPSSLNTYRNCSLQFYLQHIVKLPVPEEVEETIDARTMGNVIHQVMKDLYLPYTGVTLTADAIRKMIPQVDVLTTEHFRASYPVGDIQYGKNLLIVNIAKVMIRNYLNYESEFVQKQQEKGHKLLIELLEQEIYTSMQVTFRKEPLQVKIAGRPDRIDALGSVHRIIDYKTGNVRSSDLSLKSWEKLKNDPGAGKSFQVLLYGFIYHSLNTALTGSIEPGIISFRAPSEGLMMVNLPDKAKLDSDTMDILREMIQELVDEVFNIEEPFRKTEDRGNCEYCSFRGICLR